MAFNFKPPFVSGKTTDAAASRRQSRQAQARWATMLLRHFGNWTQAAHAVQHKGDLTEMLFSCATLVQLPSVLPEHSSGMGKWWGSEFIDQELAQKNPRTQVGPRKTDAISPLENAFARAENRLMQVLPEENFHF